MKNYLSLRFLLKGMFFLILVNEGNQCLAQSMPMPTFFIRPVLAPYYTGWINSPIPPYFKSVKKTYVITLKNDSVIKVFEKINIARSSRNPHSIIVPDGKRTKMIHPDDTKEIYELKADGSKYMGIPGKNSWLFVTQTGIITTYTVIPETDCDYVTAVQKGNEPIVDLTKENLKPMIADNKDATRLADVHNDLVRAIKVYNEQMK
jgi:hypothetical protein